MWPLAVVIPFFILFCFESFVSFVVFACSFSLNTFRYKGLLNCAGEHRGELCWESADFRPERLRPLLLLMLFYLFAEIALPRN